jgi:hypothetical protein
MYLQLLLALITFHYWKRVTIRFVFNEYEHEFSSAAKSVIFSGVNKIRKVKSFLTIYIYRRGRCNPWRIKMIKKYYHWEAYQTTVVDSAKDYDIKS